jgi:hypothetical protein
LPFVPAAAAAAACVYVLTWAGLQADIYFHSFFRWFYPTCESLCVPFVFEKTE